MSRFIGTLSRGLRLRSACVLVAAAAALTSTTLLSAQQPNAAADPNRTLVALIADLVTANRIVVDQGVIDGYGHVAVRHPSNPNRFFMVRNMAPALATPDDVIELDVATGQPVVPGAPGPVGERFIHSEILKARPDVNATIHAHTLSVVTMGVLNIEPRPVYHMAAYLAQGVPNFDMETAVGDPNLLVGDVKKGAALAKVLADHPAALMRGHGFVVTGTSLPFVVGRAVYLKHNSEMQLQAMTLNRPIKYLSDAEAKTAASASWASFPRNWDMWKAQSGRGMY